MLHITRSYSLSDQNLYIIFKKSEIHSLVIEMEILIQTTYFVPISKSLHHLYQASLSSPNLNHIILHMKYSGDLFWRKKILPSLK